MALAPVSHCCASLFFCLSKRRNQENDTHPRRRLRRCTPMLTSRRCGQELARLWPHSDMLTAPAQCAGHASTLRVCVASQWGPIQRGRRVWESSVYLTPWTRRQTCRAASVFGCPSEPTRSTGPMDVRRTAPARPACLSIAKAMRVLAAFHGTEHRSAPAKPAAM